MADPLDGIAARLYAASPDGFVAARTAEVQALRAAGDRDTATAVARLRRPTVSAWLVDLLALRRPERLTELAALGDRLRDAQRAGDGTALRRLSTRRRDLVAALVADARREAERAGTAGPVGAAALREVEETLAAAVADAELAALVRSGRLDRPLRYTGLGAAPDPAGSPAPAASRDTAGTAGTATDAAGAAARGGPGTATGGRPARGTGTDPRAERGTETDAGRPRTPRQAVAAARTAERTARAALGRAEAAERRAAERLARLDADLARIRRERLDAVADLDRANRARRAAERARTAAGRRLTEAQAAAES